MCKYKEKIEKTDCQIKKKTVILRNDSHLLKYLIHFSVFHSFGVMPVANLKLRKKDDSVANPDSVQICDSLRSGRSLSSRWAYATR